MKPSRLVFGSSRAVAGVVDSCARYAHSRHPLLILGERGTGKTALGSYIHALSDRPGSFVKRSMASQAPELEYASLAGYSRGAFTGAYQDRMGLIEAAHLGTLFLDELALASAAVQQMLLGFLDEGTLARLGEPRCRPLDVRVIGATNANLAALCEEEVFRQDLLDRFGFLRIRMPRLAERREDILELATVFLTEECKAIGTSQAPELSGRVRDCFMAAPWPGNLRELESVCRFAVLNARDISHIELADLPPDFMTTMGECFQGETSIPMEQRIQRALVATGGNKTAAARLLGMSRQHLHRLIFSVQDNLSKA